jgi:nicotinate-nucleotide adenylyltransferase
MRLGVLGGTFNPIHYGHLRAAEEARERLGLEKVLFVPAGAPPLKYSGLADADKRHAMAELAVASNRHFEVSDVEFGGQEKSYTVKTMDRLRAGLPGHDFYFILGIDAFLDLHSWKEPERLVASTDFVVIRRPPFTFSLLEGSPFLEASAGALRELDEGAEGPKTAAMKGGRTAFLMGITPLHISSSAIRGLVREQRSVKYLLPESVESFIMSNGLYAD